MSHDDQSGGLLPEPSLVEVDQHDHQVPGQGPEAEDSSGGQTRSIETVTTNEERASTPGKVLGDATVKGGAMCSKPLLKYNILSEGLYVLIVAVYMYIDEEKTKIWILQCKMCWCRTFLFGTE